MEANTCPPLSRTTPRRRERGRDREREKERGFKKIEASCYTYICRCLAPCDHTRRRTAEATASSPSTPSSSAMSFSSLSSIKQERFEDEVAPTEASKDDHDEAAGAGGGHHPHRPLPHDPPDSQGSVDLVKRGMTGNLSSSPDISEVSSKDPILF